MEGQEERRVARGGRGGVRRALDDGPGHRAPAEPLAIRSGDRPARGPGEHVRGPCAADGRGRRRDPARPAGARLEGRAPPSGGPDAVSTEGRRRLPREGRPPALAEGSAGGSEGPPPSAPALLSAEP